VKRIFGLVVPSLVLSGCQPQLGDAKTAIDAPRDPTPLARCSVAASVSSPLVTEWPATEKAHLESLVAGQTVAVQYSDCELHLLDACKLPGKYAWQKTTIATDTVDIKNEEELYAKLPLGAVSLEGELKRSGRLAVRTTVSGQLKLNDADTTNVPREGPCARATHVISGVSIGTFKLLSGGGVDARGGVSVGGAGTGGRVGRDEEVMREAGDPKKCADATPESPNGDCRSPIQVFLEPIQRPQTESEKKAAVEEQGAQKAGGVKLFFSSATTGENWSLRAAGGDLLCTLPCTRWVGAASGYVVRKDEARVHDVVTVKVPDDLPFPSGTSAEARVEPPHGNRWLALGGVVGSTAIGVVGFVLLGDAFHQATGCKYGGTYGGCPTGWGADNKVLGTYTTEAIFGTTVGVLGLAGLVFSIYYWAHVEGDHLVLKPSSSPSTARTRVRPSPFGVAGEL